MNILVENLTKLHTTVLGEARIRNNLGLEISDVVEWSRQAVRQADFITKSGKNYYVYYNGAVITINAHSYTIITAHKIRPKIRIMEESDYASLDEFLYQAIFIPTGEVAPPRNIINIPEIFIYIKNFGQMIGDLGVVAEHNGRVIGAAWTRIIHAYGHLDENTPELAISLLPEFRGYGIGGKLMNKLFKVLKENGYRQTSVSVQKDNPAVEFYLRLGYEIINSKVDYANHEDYLMIKTL